MHLPYEWQPKIVATQVALIGNVVIAGVPAEFTTMSGRRLREAIKTVMNDASDDETSVIVAGLCNTYSDYVTTPEEYQVNRRPLLPSDVFRIVSQQNQDKPKLQISVSPRLVRKFADLSPRNFFLRRVFVFFEISRSKGTKARRRFTDPTL